MFDEHIDPQLARMYLADVQPAWRSFWFHMHLMARNLREFAAGLRGLREDVFRFHVGGEKNDVAKWVQEVIGDAELAHALRAVTSSGEAAALVEERLSQLERAARG